MNPATAVLLLCGLVLGTQAARADAFGAAVESPDQNFDMGGDEKWTITSQPPSTHWADTWLQAPALTNTQQSWITTQVSGPVSIYFEATDLRFGWQEGVTYPMRFASMHHLYLPAGNHTLRWEAIPQKSGKLSRIYMEQGVGFSEALGLPEGEWQGTESGLVPFLHHPNPHQGKSGKGLVWSKDDWTFGLNSSPRLTCAIKATGFLSLWSDGFFDSFYGYGNLLVYVDDLPAVNHPGHISSIYLGPDQNTRRIRFDIIPSSPFYPDFWIDPVTLQPANRPGFGDVWLGDSFNGSGFGWWSPITDGGPEHNLSAMRDTHYGSGGTSVTGPGRISFWTKYTPPPNPRWGSGSASFYLSTPAAPRQYTFPAATGWRYFEYILPAGISRLHWRHQVTLDDLDGEMEITAPVLVNDAFAQWAADRDLLLETGAPGTDLEHDGVPNLLEWLGGTDPRSIGPSGIITTQTPEMLTYSAPREPADSAGVLLTVESSTDLANWQTSPAEPILTATHRRFQIPSPAAGPKYYRLRATLP